MMSSEDTGLRYYYVDEAGCLTLFDKRGRIIIGHEGVSKTFMVGVAQVQDPARAQAEISELRRELLADAYFRRVPSMQPNRGRTATQFHAKDDLPEIRREVFRLIRSLGVKVQIIVRRKLAMATEARYSLERFGRKIGPNAVYDDMVKRLFKNLLHKQSSRIVFARRGKADRYEALQHAIDRARTNFTRSWGIETDRQVTITSGRPSDHAGLQIIDYYLWALQRLFERGEDRYFAAMADDYRLIIDLDDKRLKKYGEYYSDSNPLELEKITPVEG